MTYNVFGGTLNLVQSINHRVLQKTRTLYPWTALRVCQTSDQANWLGLRVCLLFSSTSVIAIMTLMILASCLINAPPLPAHCPAADDWQMIGRCPVPRAVPVPISLTADAHFGAGLGALFYWTRRFENNVPLDNTTPIYLINLLWKLRQGFSLDSELHCFSIFHRE